MVTVLRKTLLSLLMLTALPAAALKDDFQNIDPKVDKVFSEIDWDQATRIDINLHDHDFMPRKLEFSRGKPYILKLKNVGAQAHDMVGGSFFQAIVIKMVSSNDGRVVTPYLKSVHVRSKHEIDIWFVPTRAGQFDFHCSLPGHQEAGMEGEILIH